MREDSLFLEKKNPEVVSYIFVELFILFYTLYKEQIGYWDVRFHM